jgi:putative transposase
VEYIGYKFRLYPTAEQQVFLAKHFGCVRWVYNYGLNTKKAAWTKRKEDISRYDLQATLPVLKKTTGTEWLAEVDAHCLQKALINLEMAYIKFFRTHEGFPKFKSKYSRQSYTLPQGGIVGEDFVKIAKIGKIKAVISRQPTGKVKVVTISKTTTGKYFASVLCETGSYSIPKLPVEESTTVGIDLGLIHYATLSTGEQIKNPRNFKKALKKLRRRSRQFSRSKNGSQNKKKTRKALALCHEQVANRRNDFLHKLTTRLVQNNQMNTFCLEDLAVSDMLQDEKKNSAYTRSMADAGWRTFRSMLEYKAERAGKNVLVIGRYDPSTKTCQCGAINHNLTVRDRVWTCPTCGAVNDRDLNAANNIKKWALHPRNQSVPQGMRESTPVESGNRLLCETGTLAVTG